MIDMTMWGYTPQDTQPQGWIPARILAVHKERYEAICPNGECHARLPGSYLYTARQAEDIPTVGDYVYLEYNPAGDSRIRGVLPRYSIFARMDSWGKGTEFAGTVHEQLVAANFHYVFIMTSLNHDFNAGRLERYASAAWQTGATPVILLTKADLSDTQDQALAQCRAIAPGVAAVAISAHTGQGMEQLEPYLTPGKTAVLLGSSGVGKSSLVNALMGRETMAVSAIREDDSRGRHTTTHRQIIMLPQGAMLIDSPGMRELGVWAAGDGIASAFEDIEALARQCRFADCRHGVEPGCAVRQALESGELSAQRWRGYENILRENAHAEKKAAQSAKRARENHASGKNGKYKRHRDSRYGQE